MPRRGCAVDIGVHEVCVDDVRTGPPDRLPDAERERRIEIESATESRIRHGESVQLGIERIGLGIIEPDKGRIHAPLPKRREECQQVPLGPSDPTEAVHVDDSHVAALAARNRLSMSCAILASPSAAGMQIRKSQGAR